MMYMDNISISVFFFPSVNQSLFTKVCLSVRLSVRCVSNSLNHPSHQFISTLNTDLESLWHKERFKLSMVTIVWHIWKIYQFPFSFFPPINKPIDKSLSVCPFVRSMCKSLFKAPFPSIHINFKHRFGILVTQGAF